MTVFTYMAIYGIWEVQRNAPEWINLHTFMISFLFSMTAISLLRVFMVHPGKATSTLVELL